MKKALKLERAALFWVTEIVLICALALLVWSLITFNFKTTLDLAIIVAIFFFVNKNLRETK